ncbi:hypothetical protein [Myroides sp. N17-2]|uniref:hypothetical protein n=1 Tax=Myroides sp. N17-2 TaxID=2030799 RepID=UPI001180B0DA|nr:hypothetical protein [Myroides sp. N17-2]
MKNILCLVMLMFTFTFSFAQDKEEVTVAENTKVNSKKKRDISDKLVKMDGYIACNFTKLDEEKAIADGHVVQGYWSMKDLKEFIMKDRNVLPNAIFVISSSGSFDFGEYEVCAGGIYYKYYSNRQNGYTRNK